MTSLGDQAPASGEESQVQKSHEVRNPRKIVLATFGSAGDLNPMIAVALHLKAAGFSPVIATTETFRGTIEREGLGFWPVRPNAFQIARDQGISIVELAQKLMTQSLKFLIDTTITPYLEETYADLNKVMIDAEVVVVSSFNFMGRLVAEKHDIPLVSVLLSPMLFYSVDDPPCYIDTQWLPRVRAIFGRTVTKFAMAMVSAQVGKQLQRVNEFRAAIGLPKSNRVELLDGPMRGEIIAGLYSPHLAKLPADAPPQSLLAGFVFYDKSAAGPIPLSLELQNFLERGSAPIVFTLGSMIARNPAQFYDESARAVRSLGRRAVLLVGPGSEAEISGKFAGDDIFVAGYVPHSLVFPYACVVVHHGGIGTIAQAMRAGKPQLVCPLLGDQVDNAERLKRIGVGGRLDLKKYNAARAVNALRPLIGEKARAAIIAAQIAPEVAKEDGASTLAGKILALPCLQSAAS